MRILYVCSDPSVSPGSRGGGFTTHMEETIRSLRKLGHEVVVLDTKNSASHPAAAASPAGSASYRTPGQSAGAPVNTAAPPARQDSRISAAGSPRRRLPRVLKVLVRDVLYCLHNLRFYPRVSSLLKGGHGFDLVYERYYAYQFATSVAARRNGVPLVLEFNASIDEMNLNEGLGLRPVAVLIEKSVAGTADAVLVVSSVLKDFLVLNRKLPACSVHVMHNAASLDTFSPSIPGEPLRQKYGFSRDDVVVGFVGGFSVWHGAHLLLEVAPLANLQNKNLRFLMVGGREGNPRFEDFKRGVVGKGLEEVFRFSGEVPRDRVPEHIAAMDVSVIPWATDYGSPTKTFEYMGMGKALVAPRVPALQEVLEDGESALLVEPGNVRQIADALVALASDVALREKLGRNARRLVEEKYNWDRNAAVTIEIAGEVLKRKGGGLR